MSGLSVNNDVVSEGHSEKMDIIIPNGIFRNLSESRVIADTFIHVKQCDYSITV